MPKLCRVTKVKVRFLVVVYVFNFKLFELSATILEKGLLPVPKFIKGLGPTYTLFKLHHMKK